MFDAAKHAWTWFIGGLAESVLAATDRIKRRDAYRVIVGERVVVHAASGMELGVLSAKGAVQGLAPELTARLTGADLDVEVPAAWLWRRSLNPVATRSAPFLDAFVRHNIERISPWRAADVYYRIVTSPLKDDPTHVAVEVGIIARRLVASVLSVIEPLQPARLRLVAPSIDGTDFTIRIGDRSQLRYLALRRKIGLATMAVATIVIIVLGGLLWQSGSIEADIAELDHQISEQKAVLAASRRRGPEDDATARLRALRANRPRAVELLDALSRTLPDHAYLTDLRLEKDRLQISGVTRQSADLVPALEQSHSFINVAFFAATTRLENGAADRFHLEMQLGAREDQP